MQPVTQNGLLFAFIFFYGVTKMEENEGVPKKYVFEGDNVTIHCYFGRSLEDTVVHWKNKDGKEVFFFQRGQHTENGQNGQDEQYKGRVSLFYKELKNGNASMILRDAKIEDTGNYTCILPYVRSGGPRFTATTELIVEPVYKNRFGLKKGAVHRPVLGISNVTDAGVELQCVVTGSSSEPSVEWATCEGIALNATGQPVPDPRGRYDTTRLVTVTETTTNCFRCVVKQKDIYHVIDNKITVPGKLFEKKSFHDTHGHVTRGNDAGHGCDTGVLIGMWCFGAVIGAILGALALHWLRSYNTRHRTQAQKEMNGQFEMVVVEEVEEEEVILMLSYNTTGEIDGGVLLEIVRYDGVKVLYRMSRRGSVKSLASKKSKGSVKSVYCNDSS